MWFKRLKDYLCSKGFTDSVADLTLFVYTGKVAIYILVYVDDMVINRSDQAEVDLMFEIWVP